MKTSHLFIVCMFWMSAASVLMAQDAVRLVGFVSEDNNRGYLALVDVVATDRSTGSVAAQNQTDADGKFEMSLPAGALFDLKYSKRAFEDRQDTLSTIGVAPGDRLFTKTRLTRKPGYIFEATMAAKAGTDNMVPAIHLSTIEIFNQTADSVELILENYNSPFFSFTFEQGNHYSMLIRAPGFLPKRMEAYVNVEGCILCLDGIGGVRPGVTDNLTAGHQMGVLLANLSLEPAPKNHEDWQNDYSLADLVMLEKLEKMGVGMPQKSPSDSPQPTQPVIPAPVQPALLPAQQTTPVSSNGNQTQTKPAATHVSHALVVADESANSEKTISTEQSVDVSQTAHANHDPYRIAETTAVYRSAGEPDDVVTATQRSVPATEQKQVSKPAFVPPGKTQENGWSLKINQTNAVAEPVHQQTAGFVHDSLHCLQHAPHKLADMLVEVGPHEHEPSTQDVYHEPQPHEINQLDTQSSGYFIQVLSTKGALSPTESDKLASLIGVFTEQRGMYTVYLIGAFDSRPDAELQLEKQVKALFPMAFIIQYMHGQRI
jgi:hypothetical protein